MIKGIITNQRKKHARDTGNIHLISNCAAVIPFFAAKETILSSLSRLALQSGE